MKLHEVAILNEPVLSNTTITEEMLTEGFIDDTLKPKLQSIFSKKAKNQGRYKSQFQSKLNEHKKVLEANGIDSRQTEKIIENNVKKASPKELNQSIIRNQLSEIFEELKNNNITQFSNATVIAIVAIIVVNIVGVILEGFFAPATAFTILAILFAPVIEDFGKYIAIKKEQTGAFLIAFNIGEYIIWMFNASLMGISMAEMAIWRTIPVIFHTLWAAIIRHSYRSGESSPYLSSMVLHSLYNAFPIIGGAITVAVGLQSDKTLKRKQIEDS